MGAVTPVTNPVVTPMCNAMFALKGKNADCDRAASAYGATSTNMLWTCSVPSLKAGPAGRPDPDDRASFARYDAEVMKTADVVVATGGAGMVKSAYSSGNRPLVSDLATCRVIIDRGVDYDAAASMIIAGA